MIGLELKEDATKLFEQLRAQKVLVTRIPPKILRILPPLTAHQTELDLFIEEVEKAFKAIGN
jgi:acetylornithine/succinyldiaminopimelate/putrescine aminotransferase